MTHGLSDKILLQGEKRPGQNLLGPKPFNTLDLVTRSRLPFGPRQVKIDTFDNPKAFLHYRIKHGFVKIVFYDDIVNQNLFRQFPTRGIQDTFALLQMSFWKAPLLVLAAEYPQELRCFDVAKYNKTRRMFFLHGRST